MKYEEFQPNFALRDVVESFWYFASSEVSSTYRILPDGCADIIFNLGAATPSMDAQSIGLTGMMTHYADTRLGQNTEMFGVRFRPGMLSQMTAIPLIEARNLTVDARAFNPVFNSGMLERLAIQPDLSRQFAFLEQQFRELVPPTAPDPLVAQLVALLQQAGQPIRMTRLAQQFGLSLRQLERRFKAVVGLSPKEFASISRFKKAKQAIGESGRSLLDIAFDYGYFDHAHLSRDFRQIAGRPPSHFR